MNKIKYSDIKVLISEDEIKSRVKELGAELNKLYEGKEVCAISVLKGSVIFAADLVREFTFPVKLEFIRLSSYGSSTVTSGEVRVIDSNLPDLSDKNIIIIEDIIDSGYTADYMLNFIKNKYKPLSVTFVSLLDKKVSRKVDVAPDYYGFEIDDKFVVGYGLDYDGDFRNLKYIGYADKSLLNK